MNGKVFSLQETSQLIEEGISPIVSTLAAGIPLAATGTYHVAKKALTNITPLKIAAAISNSPEAFAATTAATIIGKKVLTKTVGKEIQNKLFSSLSIDDRKKPISANIAASDTPSNSNKIQIKPEGVVIQDTYNNLIFPIPEPQIDTSKFNLPTIKYYYKNIYTKSSVDFLPWHYCIEMIEGQYYVFSTRPIDMKYPINTKIALELIKTNNLLLNKSTELFFQNRPFDLCDSIHVCLIGDTNKDVYIDKLYEIIGRLCVGPILRYWRLPTNTGLRVIDFNIGNKFQMEKLDLYLKR